MKTEQEVRDRLDSVWQHQQPDDDRAGGRETPLQALVQHGLRIQQNLLQWILDDDLTSGP